MIKPPLMKTIHLWRLVTISQHISLSMHLPIMYFSDKETSLWQIPHFCLPFPCFLVFYFTTECNYNAGNATNAFCETQFLVYQDYMLGTCGSIVKGLNKLLIIGKIADAVFILSH